MTDLPPPRPMVDGAHDAVLVVSFGGPEGPDDVLPFLQNVTRGRGIPDERLVEVGAHYAHFDGISPINEQCRRLVAALEAELASAGRDLPVYWGNRNWHPMLTDTVQTMADDGIGKAVVIVTSAFSSYSGCRQYRDDLAAAQAAVGPTAPELDKIRPYFDHPGFVEPLRDATAAEIGRLAGGDAPAAVVCTAHSIPSSMAAACDYEIQLAAVADLITGGLEDAAASRIARTDVVFQSRSGPPQVPWLEPDVNDHLRTLVDEGIRHAVIVPIGFVSDHMEVMWDLDEEAAATAAELGMDVRRAATPGTTPDPRFVTMWRQLIEEKLDGAPRAALSALPARPDPCAEGCCPAPSRPTRPR